MKRTLLSLIAALSIVSLVAPTEAEAHGGGLDFYGCHHNRTLGGYDCHRGTHAGESDFLSPSMLAASPRDNTDRRLP